MAHVMLSNEASVDKHLRRRPCTHVNMYLLAADPFGDAAELQDPFGPPVASGAAEQAPVAQGAAQEGADPFAELAMSARSSVAGARPEQAPLLCAWKLCCGRDCAGRPSTVGAALVLKAVAQHIALP